MDCQRDSSVPWSISHELQIQADSHKWHNTFQELGVYRGVGRGGSSEPLFWQAGKQYSFHIKLAFHQLPCSSYTTEPLHFQIMHAGGRPLTISTVTIAIKVGVVAIKWAWPRHFRMRFARVSIIEPPFQNSCLYAELENWVGIYCVQKYAPWYAL